MDVIEFPREITTENINKFKIFWLSLTDNDWTELYREWLGHQSKAAKRTNFAEWLLKDKIFPGET